MKVSCSPSCFTERVEPFAHSQVACCISKVWILINPVRDTEVASTGTARNLIYIYLQVKRREMHAGYFSYKGMYWLSLPLESWCEVWIAVRDAHQAAAVAQSAAPGRQPAALTRALRSMTLLFSPRSCKASFFLLRIMFLPLCWSLRGVGFQAGFNLTDSTHEYHPHY